MCFWPEAHELVSITTTLRLPSAVVVQNVSAPAQRKCCNYETKKQESDEAGGLQL